MKKLYLIEMWKNDKIEIDFRDKNKIFCNY